LPHQPFDLSSAADHVVGRRVAGGVAHQQVAVLRQREPLLQQVPVAHRVGVETVDTEQVAVGLPAAPRRLGLQFRRPQPRDHVRLAPQRQLAPGRRPTRPQPRPMGRVRVARLQRVEQDAAHLRQLMHMLVAVHVVRGRAPAGLETVQLALDPLLQCTRIELAQPGAQDHALQRLARDTRQRFGQVQVQPDIDRVRARGLPQGVGAAGPGRAVAHHADGADAAGAGELHAGVIDAVVQTVVIDADRQAADRSGGG